jgi:prepilin-type N-terminal cleavage/methylation domain-containing protein
MIAKNAKLVEYRSRPVHARRGLTLVELLIVIAIVSVITAISLPVTKDLIQQNRVSESVRTVRSFLEAARAQAMNTGREHGVAFNRRGAGDGELAGAVTRLELVSAAPPYRGDVEGARCTLVHESVFNQTAYTTAGTMSGTPPAAGLGTLANAAIFDAVQCPTLFRTLKVLRGDENVGSVVPISDGDWLQFDGQRFQIVAFSECDSTDPVITGDPANWIKVFFDPRAYTGDVRLNGAPVMSIATPPTLPPGGFRQSTFEIQRSRMRGGSTELELVSGAAIDLYFSGAGPGGTEFSPLSIWNADPSTLTGSSDLLPVVVVFAPSGNVSRVLFGQRVGTTAVVVPREVKPKTTMHFLVGRSDQVRPDLLGSPLGLNPDSDTDTSNITDLDSHWLSINPLNGRITTSEIGGLAGTPTTIVTTVAQARRPANAALESN